MWNVRETVIPVIIDALGTVPKGLKRGLGLGLLGFMAYVGYLTPNPFLCK